MNSRTTLRSRLLERVLRAEVALRSNVGAGRPHHLNAELIVSLTSFPPRYGTLCRTIRCLLNQSVRPDHVILWVTELDRSTLPRSVLALQEEGLTIRLCGDLRSYKKLIPCLVEFPGAYVATADDDTFYGRHWLETLVDTCEPTRKEILGRRAHAIILNQDELPSSYNDWRLEVPTTTEGDLLFLTGVGGILYPPGVLGPGAVDYGLAEKLCPTADDIWFHFMAREERVPLRRVGRPSKPRSWISSQSISLMDVNVAKGGNDRQMRAMTEHFGFRRH